MQVTREHLSLAFASKSTGELLEQHASGTLTDLAYDVLERELAKRGAPPPPRPVVSQKRSGVTPRSIRIVFFLLTLVAINAVWAGGVSRFIGGAVPYLLFVGVPSVAAYVYFFGRRSRKKSGSTG